MATLTFDRGVLNSLGTKMDLLSKNLSEDERNHLLALVILGRDDALKLKGQTWTTPPVAATRLFAEAIGSVGQAVGQTPPTVGTMTDGRTCMDNCLSTPGSTFWQCYYYCARLRH